MNTQEQEVHDYSKFPLVYPETGKQVIFVKDKKEVVAYGRVVAYSRGSLRIGYNPETMSYFKDDEIVKTIPDFAFFSFFAFFGEPSESFTDYDEKERLKGIRLVDAFDFEWGLSPKEFKDVPGFGVRDKSKPDYYVNQVKRRKT